MSPYNRLQLEKAPAAEIFALDLHPESALFAEDASVQAIDDQLSRPVWHRITTVMVLAAILLTAGFLYQEIGGWRDRRQFPQIGEPPSCVHGPIDPCGFTIRLSESH
jgi:hypothetical protein